MHCTRLPGRALAQVVDGRHDDGAPRLGVPAPADRAAVRAPHLAQLAAVLRPAARRTARSAYAPAIERVEPSPPDGTCDVHRAQDARGSPAGGGARTAAPARAPARAQLLLDLGPCRCAADAVRTEVLVHLGEELLDLGAASRARRARLGVDHDRLDDEPGTRQRREPEQRARRVAARDRDQPRRSGGASRYSSGRPYTASSRSSGAGWVPVPAARSTADPAAGNLPTGRATRRPRGEHVTHDRRGRRVRQRGEHDSARFGRLPIRSGAASVASTTPMRNGYTSDGALAAVLLRRQARQLDAGMARQQAQQLDARRSRWRRGRRRARAALQRPARRDGVIAPSTRPRRGAQRERVAAAQRFEYCGRLRALWRPYFLRSTSRESRVMKPAFLSAGRSSGLAIEERARDAVADGDRLRATPPPSDVHVASVLARSSRVTLERLMDDHPRRLAREVLVERCAVDRDLPVAGRAAGHARPRSCACLFP